MPKPDQQTENVQKKANKDNKFYDPLKEQEGQLYKDSLMETYLHNVDQYPSYVKKAHEHRQVPPENGSFSGFKKVFKGLGRFLTGTPNYYELYDRTESNWGAFNLYEVSDELKKDSDEILLKNEKTDPKTKKKEIPRDDVYTAFTKMSKNGQFFDSNEGPDVLMNFLNEDLQQEQKDQQNQEGQEEDKAEKKSKKDEEAEKKLQDARAAAKALEKFRGQLKYFKDGNGSLSPESVAALQEDFFFNNACSKYIFELITGAKASPESFEFANKNHPLMIQMIFYTQILNQMDIAINQILLVKNTNILGTSMLNLEQYAHLLAQKKETNRLLTELMSKTDIKKDFENKFSGNAQKDAAKADQEEIKENDKIKTEEPNKKVQALGRDFIKLQNEYKELIQGKQQDKQQAFLRKNLKKILNLAAEISESQGSEEEKDADGFLTPKSKIKNYVGELAKDPFAFDYFLIPKHIEGLKYLLNGVAYMIPGSKISQGNNGNEIAADLSIYKETYSQVKKTEAAFATEALENPDSLLLMLPNQKEAEVDSEKKSNQENKQTDSEKTLQNMEPLHFLKETYKGFHSEELENFNNLYSVFNKITGDQEALQALLATSLELQQFQDVYKLITLDHALYILEKQSLQKNEYYGTLTREIQKFQASLPLLERWYKIYTANIAKKEKEQSAKDFSDQLNLIKGKAQGKDNQNNIETTNAEKLLATLKNFIEKNPINKDNNNAAIYNRISQSLTNANIVKIIKKPTNLEHVLSLSEFILKMNQDNSTLSDAEIEKITKSYQTITAALQEAQKQADSKELDAAMKAHKQIARDDLKAENDSAKKRISGNNLSEVLEMINVKYIANADKDPISPKDARKLVNAFSKFIEAHTASEEEKSAEVYKRTVEFLGNGYIYTSLKDEATLKAFLQIVDYVKIQKNPADLGRSKQADDKDSKIESSLIKVEERLHAVEEETKQNKKQQLKTDARNAIMKAVVAERLGYEVDDIYMRYFNAKVKNSQQQIPKKTAENLVNALRNFIALNPVDKTSKVDPENQDKKALYERIMKSLTNSYASTVIQNKNNLWLYMQLLSHVMDNQENPWLKERALLKEKAPTLTLKRTGTEMANTNDEILSTLQSFEASLFREQLKSGQKHPNNKKVTKAIQTGSLKFYPTRKGFNGVPANEATPEEIEEQKKREKEDQRILNQQIDDQINKIEEEKGVEERRSSLQTLNEFEAVPKQEAVKIQTKKTGCITTISTWFSKILGKKSAEATMNADTNPLMQEIDAIGSLKELAEEEIKVEKKIHENVINEKPNDIKQEKNKEEEVQEKQEEKNVESVQDKKMVDENNDPKIDEQMKQLEKENDKEEEIKQREKQASKNPTVGDIFVNYKSENEDHQDVNAEIEKLQKVLNQEANNNQINESKPKSSIQQSNQKNVPIKLDEKNLPRTFQEMQDVNYEVTRKMKTEFINLQKWLIETRSNDTIIQKNADMQPEYYANYHLLYEAFQKNPTNVLLVKILNLLKCNDTAILQKGIQELLKMGKEHIDPLLLKHLEKRIKMLTDLNKIHAEIYKTSTRTLRNNSFWLSERIHQKQESTPNICWSIALSNLLACQGIKIAPELIRSARVEDEKLDTSLGYKGSNAYVQSQRGEFNNVAHGFKQIQHIDAVKNYECIDDSYGMAQTMANTQGTQPVTWDDWFISKLKESFDGDKVNRDTSSAMSFSDNDHIITILGFKDINALNSDSIILYIHDSFHDKKSETISLETLKKHIFQKHRADKADEQLRALQNTAIAYLKKKETK